MSYYSAPQASALLSLLGEWVLLTNRFEEESI